MPPTPHSLPANAPLFGLRWVPDAQLRPLRYLPNALNAAPTSDPNWWRSRQEGRDTEKDTVTPQRKSATPGTVADESPVGAGSAAAASVKLQQSVRILTQRLTEAQEAVRQKSEQIRWLKEMTRDDASRLRVARWMRGPLLRVFLAWRRCVRESQRRALDDLTAELSSHSSRQRELQVQSDDLTREHAVLQTAIEHYFNAAIVQRGRRRLAECWRRWAPLRMVRRLLLTVRPCPPPLPSRPSRLSGLPRPARPAASRSRLPACLATRTCVAASPCAWAGDHRPLHAFHRHGSARRKGAAPGDADTRPARDPRLRTRAPRDDRARVSS